MISNIINIEEYRLTIIILVKPNSVKNELILINDELILKIKAVRQKGKANKEIIKFLGKILGIPNSNIEIIQGNLSTTKIIAIYNSDVETISDRLSQYLDLE